MKKLNTNSITNELENSSFFPGRRTPQAREEESARKAPPAPAALERVQIVQPQATVSRQKEPSRKPLAKPVSPVPAASRQYVRRTFDLYEDQLAYLTRASLEERLAGGEGSMNAMVREAIDTFIEARKKK
jgi:hypothetical protein